jgi:hypothetical protein
MVFPPQSVFLEVSQVRRGIGKHPEEKCPIDDGVRRCGLTLFELSLASSASWDLLPVSTLEPEIALHQALPNLSAGRQGPRGKAIRCRALDTRRPLPERDVGPETSSEPPGGTGKRPQLDRLFAVTIICLPTGPQKGL